MPILKPRLRVRPRAGAGWGWILAYGVLSVVLGVMAFASPFSATYAATLVIGAFFIAAGVVSIVSGFAGKGHEGARLCDRVRAGVAGDRADHGVRAGDGGRSR
ncbi:DUF308 domain-containing protein [Sphingomonas sp. H160509]|uniref:DUF308 domain-containing protein n=1 Tax=Sphingomonas sp. H160509 TaxID=2955313 RepID=UPI0020981C3A|nr:DUF308 domain-containing protein [Sphingomonas sp. H160509]MDD1451390.1 DUF308 domain-containing protein [Sphingomonas sp. H160509]